MTEKLRSSIGSNNDSVEYMATKHSTFMTSLEDWINEILSRNGHKSEADGATIKLILERYLRGFQANIEYYQGMTKYADGKSDTAISKHYKLMAKIYQSMLSADRRI
jgi:hypothetical protein